MAVQAPGLPRARYLAVRHEQVTLEEHEAQRAWENGRGLRVDALADGRRDKPSIVNGERSNCLGALAEAAAAKALGLPAKFESRVYRPPDLAHGIEVKLIGYAHWGLRVALDYPDDLRVIGVVIPMGSDPRGCTPGPWAIPGWCYARDARILASRMEISMLALTGLHPDAHAVPQTYLRGLDGLRALIAGRDPEDVDALWPLGSNWPSDSQD